MSFKILHTFTVSIDREVPEVNITEENGKKVTRESMVTKSVPTTFVLKEPSRRERQDLAMFQTIMYNEAITKGLLPKVVMQQKVARDTNSPISEDEDRNISAMNQKLTELSNDYMRLNVNSEPDTDEMKARKDRLRVEYMVLSKKVEDLNTAYQSIYAYTAESYMQNKMLSWLTLFLTFTRATPEAKPEPFFVGADFAAKEERAADLDDAVDPIYKLVVDKLPTYWMLYLFNRASTPEDFARIEVEWKKQTDAAQKIKDEAMVKVVTPTATVEPVIEPTPVETAPVMA